MVGVPWEAQSGLGSAGCRDRWPPHAGSAGSRLALHKEAVQTGLPQRQAGTVGQGTVVPYAAVSPAQP